MVAKSKIADVMSVAQNCEVAYSPGLEKPVAGCPPPPTNKKRLPTRGRAFRRVVKKERKKSKMKRFLCIPENPRKKTCRKNVQKKRAKKNVDLQ